jgi:hypothetical protein
MADTGGLCERSRIFILNAATIRALSTVLKITLSILILVFRGSIKLGEVFNLK